MRLLAFIRWIFGRQPRSFFDFEQGAEFYPPSQRSWPGEALEIAKVTYPEGWGSPKEVETPSPASSTSGVRSFLAELPEGGSAALLPPEPPLPPVPSAQTEPTPQIASSDMQPRPITAAAVIPAPYRAPEAGEAEKPSVSDGNGSIRLPQDARVLLGFGDGSMMALKEGHPLTKQFVRAADRLTGTKWLRRAPGTND